MPTSPLNAAIQHLLADLRPGGDGGMTDAELLYRFLRSRDEGALADLVRRHARMVWGVCRRALNHHDAEDAFQATFLVLVRKAAGVPRRAVAGWLYGVARRTAVRLRAAAARRGRREAQVVNMPEPTARQARDADLRSLLDEELGRLPEHYRGALVLCDLEGLTRGEAARQLGIPEGSVASRLARARALLARRLTRRGVVPAGVSVAMVRSAESASASAPPALVASTIQAASLFATGKVATGVISARALALTEGVVKTMFVTRLKNVLTVVLVVGVALVVAAGLLHQTPAAEPSQAKGEQPAAPEGPAKGGAGPGMVKQQQLPALIDKILAAHGGEDKLRNLPFTMTVKHSNGSRIQYFVQPPKHFRWEMTHRDSTTKKICILRPTGRMWWHKSPNGPPTPVIYMGWELPMEFHLDYYVRFFGPRQVLRLKDANHKVTLLDEEAKIAGRAAVGVEVTGPQFMGKMYFDKETHLLVKSPAGWYLAGQGAVTYGEYKKFDGIPMPQREHDGYLEPILTDFRAVEKFDAKLFEQP